MQDIMEEKVEKGFMTINKLKSLLLFMLGLSMILSSCKDEGYNVFIDDLPPTPPFELSLNLSLVSNQNLVLNDHLYRDDVGINGVVVVKVGANSYRAYDRTCPYQPEEPCSRVDYLQLGTESSILFCQCEDANYSAKDGFSTKRPTDTPKRLRQYNTQLSGNILLVNSIY